MKSRFWIFVLVVAMVLLFWVLWLRPNQPVRAVEQKTEVSPAVASAPVVRVPQSPPPITPSFREILKRMDPAKIKRGNEAFDKRIQARNLPIDFYGQTVDQDGHPLPGVHIKMIVPHYLPGMEGMSIIVNRTSHSDGLFDIHDSNVTGDGIDVEGMGKEGYTLEPMTRSFAPAGGSPGNPLIFKLWRDDIKEPLITGQKSFPIEPNGKPYVLDLGNGTIADSGEGDLRVWIKYDIQTVHGQPSDWLSEINVMDGGLLLEPDLSSAMYVAPTNGYVPAFQYNQQINGGQRGSTGEKRFFVMLKDGRQYGRIVIGLYAPYNNQTPGLIRISYAINPTGSRILK